MMIRENLESIKKELPSGVKLVAVSKYHPLGSITEALNEGQTIFGESRPQEFKAKVEALRGAGIPDGTIEWHFIGHLQTNKLKMVLPYATLVQSIDSVHLLEAVNRWGRENCKVVDALLEVHVAAEETKTGFSPEQVSGVVSRSAEYPSVRICGLMGMATNTDDEIQVRSDFGTIRSLFDAVRLGSPEKTDFKELSIGMSDDWRIALDYKPTIIRIGTAIFGAR